MGECVAVTEWTSEMLLNVVRDSTSDPVPVLVTALTSPDSRIRSEAIHYLKEIPSSRAVGPLSGLLLNDPEEDIRWEAAEALGVIGDPAAHTALLKAASDENSMVRLCVAEALGMLGDDIPEVLKALCTLVVDTDEQVRIFALEALANLGNASAALPAIHALPKQSPYVRVWVHYARHRLGDAPFDLGDTLTLLRRGSMRTRTQAAKVLAYLVTPQNARTVLRALRVARDRETSVGMREAMERFLKEAEVGLQQFRE